VNHHEILSTTVCAITTVALLLIWYAMEKKAMTPYDIYRKWKSDLTYIAPEETGIMLAKTSRAIRAVEDIFDACGPNTDAGVEAVEVLQRLRKFETNLRLRR
jgi:hypothetical protein